MSVSFKVSANHISVAYQIDGKIFHVAKNADDCGLVGYHRARPEHGIPEEYYAKLSGFGCGKSFSNARAAIRSLLADNGCTNIRIEEIELPLFAKEFPDFPIADMPTIPAGFDDVSWHNDSCPSFLNESLGLIIFVDYADINKREIQDDDLVRFTVNIWDNGNTGNCLCFSNDWTDIQKVIIAYEFSAVLKSWLEPREWNAMRRTNAALVDMDVCASHDYCDANMAMLEGWQRVTGKDSIDGDNEADCILWGAAWQFARLKGLIQSTQAELDQESALAAEYVALIGYDPFEDDASATIESVTETLTGYKAILANPELVNEIVAPANQEDIGALFVETAKEHWINESLTSSGL